MPDRAEDCGYQRAIRSSHVPVVASRRPGAIGTRRTSLTSAAAAARGNAMPGLRGVPKSSYPRRYVYGGGGTPAPLQIVNQHHGNQDGKRYQEDQHEGHRHPPVRRSPTYVTGRTQDDLLANWSRSCAASHLCSRTKSPGRVGDSSRSRPLRERPSDEVSDNRHRQRWTPADTHGRPVAGQLSCDAGSPRLYLASGRRGQCRRSGAAQHGDSRTDLLDPPICCRTQPYLIKRGACGAAGPASAPGLRPWEARPGARRAAPADPADLPGSSGTQIGAARSRLPGARLSRARSSGPSRPAGC